LLDLGTISSRMRRSDGGVSVSARMLHPEFFKDAYSCTLISTVFLFLFIRRYTD